MLVEQVGPVKVFERPDPERVEIEKKISDLIARGKAAQELDHGIVAELLKIADDTKRSAMWVYHSLAKTEIGLMLMPECSRIVEPVSSLIFDEISSASGVSASNSMPTYRPSVFSLTTTRSRPS